MHGITWLGLMEEIIHTSSVELVRERCDLFVGNPAWDYVIKPLQVWAAVEGQSVERNTVSHLDTWGAAAAYISFRWVYIQAVGVN